MFKVYDFFNYVWIWISFFGVIVYKIFCYEYEYYFKL